MDEENRWTFYRDSHPTQPYIGAAAPYSTSMPGVWRFGRAPHDNMDRFIEAVRNDSR